MKTTTRFRLLPVLTLLAVAGALAGCGKSGGTPKKSGGPPKPAVTVECVEQTDFVRQLALTGRVEPTVVARLSSSAEGPIVFAASREGDTVHAGQELFRIGRRESSDAAVLSAAEEMKRQQEDLRRVEQLVQSGITSRDQLDAARAAYEKARAALALASQQSGDYCVQAPWDGVVSSVSATLGNYAAPRTVLAEMYDPSSLVLRFSVPEEHAFVLQAGTRIKTRFDAVPGKVFDLTVNRAFGDIDARLRLRRFEAALPEGVSFLPGMFARLRVVLEEQPAALTIPVDALLDDGVKPFVFLAVGDRAVRRPVEPGFEQDGRVWIRSGLQEGDRVIVGGVERVKDGAEIRIEEEKPSAPEAAPKKAHAKGAEQRESL